MKLKLGNPLPNPCKGCTRRCTGCATTCEPWQEYEAKRNIMYEERFKQNQAKAVTRAAVAREKKRLRSRRNK